VGQGWILLVAGAAVAGAIILVIRISNDRTIPNTPPAVERAGPVAATPPAPAAVQASSLPAVPAQATVPIPADLLVKLRGSWQRTDADYVLSLQEITADGKITATYMNPKAIHVATSYLGQRDAKFPIYIELRDIGYPGSYYVLDYDAALDVLTGVYYHMGIHRLFEVSFVRVK
jgi:hypothetical protein